MKNKDLESIARQTLPTEKHKTSKLPSTGKINKSRKKGGTTKKSSARSASSPAKQKKKKTEKKPEPKAKSKLKDLGGKKSKAEKSSRIQATSEKGNKRFYKELRLKEKAANERMRQLELRGIKSPAYQSVQAQLEMLGKRTKGDRGRRFSETGKATYAEMEVLNKMLDEFLKQKTSTITGAKEYERDVWETANKNQKLSAAGISKNDWLDFWASMPDRKERLYGSSQIVAMLRSYTIKRDAIKNMSSEQRDELVKNGELTDSQLEQFIDNKFTVEDIADEIQNSKDLKSAYEALGLSRQEVNSARIKVKR